MKEASLSIKALDKSEKAQACLTITFLGYRRLDRSSSLSMTLGDGIPDRSLHFPLSRAGTVSDDCNNWECFLPTDRLLELYEFLEDFSDSELLRFYPCIDIKPKKDSAFYDYLEPYELSQKVIEPLLDEIRLLRI
jgi:hypothetical protein